MKKFILPFLAAAVVISTGCVNTVSDTKKFSVTPWSKDSLASRYNRSVNQCYQAAMTVIAENGVLIREYIPHDTTNTVRALEAKVNQRNVWIRVEGVDPKITEVNVQARSPMGVSDIDLVAELKQQIGIQLSR